MILVADLIKGMRGRFTQQFVARNTRTNDWGAVPSVVIPAGSEFTVEYPRILEDRIFISVDFPRGRDQHSSTNMSKAQRKTFSRANILINVRCIPAEIIDTGTAIEYYAMPKAMKKRHERYSPYDTVGGAYRGYIDYCIINKRMANPVLDFSRGYAIFERTPEEIREIEISEIWKKNIIAAFKMPVSENTKIIGEKILRNRDPKNVWTTCALFSKDVPITDNDDIGVLARDYIEKFKSIIGKKKAIISSTYSHTKAFTTSITSTSISIDIAAVLCDDSDVTLLSIAFPKALEIITIGER